MDENLSLWATEGVSWTINTLELNKNSTDLKAQNQKVVG